jgi:beta-glucosidase
VLFGDVNPSGKLPESFPKKLSDNPSYLFYGGEGNEADYREGIFVGYRYYDKKDMEVLFPFGHGLSYTTFAFENLRLSTDSMKDTETLTATVTVKNTGSRPGKTVVQLYAGRTQPGSVIRPVRELKGFDKVFLNPGESRDVTFTLDKRSFAYWNEKIHDWHAGTGWYSVEIGHSSRDIALCASVYVESTVRLPRNYTADTILMDLMADPEAMAVLAPYLTQIRQIMNLDAGTVSEAAAEAITAEMNSAMMNYMPIRGALSFGAGLFTEEMLEAVLYQLNNL